MQIKIEDLAPKKLINFYPPQAVCLANQAALFLPESSAVPPLARAILEIEGVTGCLVSDVLIGVSFSENANKADLTALVLAELDDYFSAGGEILQVAASQADLPFMEALADSFIRPTLNRDKGDIKIISYKGGILQLQFTGHCAGCPYAQNTLNNVIAGCFKRYVPQLNDIQVKA